MRVDTSSRPDWSSPRNAWRILTGVLVLYALSFALYYPFVITVRDEGTYVRQARLLLQGTAVIEATDPFSGEVFEAETIQYPVGTALLMLPFVAVAGWRGAFASSLLCFVAGVWLTALWLRREGRSPLFTLLLPGFPAALVMGRIGMSAAPSLLVAALGLWLFWRGLDEEAARPRAWLACGFAAGASLLLREANVLLFAPLFAGSVIRRDRHAWALVVGGLLGVGARLLSGQLVYGDPFFYKPVEPFGLEYVLENLPLQALALLVFVPGGLVAGLAYRGRRSPELVTTVAIFSVFYLVYSYSGATSTWPKRIVLFHRFFIPLLPILAFAAAEVVPRAWRRFLDGADPDARLALRRLAGVAIAVWIAGVAVASAAVHPVFHTWSRTQAQIRDEIFQHTGEDSVLITNWPATGKFIDLLYGVRLPLDRDTVGPQHVAHLLQRHGELFVVFLDRSDSPAWREDARRNSAFVRTLPRSREILYDRQVTATDRLRIWRVEPPTSRR